MKLYGIRNCDTVKKARAWLADQGIEMTFHDFKSEGVTMDQLDRWVKAVSWETLLNRKGTTWRGLPDEVKDGVTDAASAKRVMLENPSVIKRPVLELDDKVNVGFSPEKYNELFDYR
ncbi:MAG TPA: ArsC family reductase [Burkholderiales bacterium]|nr:ArsC family reductase [Burkholderiales bacterium]